MFGLFGKKKKAPPKPRTLDQLNSDELKSWSKGVKKELKVSMRAIDRHIFDSERTLKNSEKELEKKIKEGIDKKVLKMYAQNVIKARGTRDKHKVNRIKVQSVEYSINQMVMNVKMAKVMGSAGKILGKVNGMMNIQEINQNMVKLQGQFEKHGIVAEMMEDAMDMDDDMDSVDENVDDLLEQMEAKINPKKVKTKNTQENQHTDELDDQIKNLTL